MTGGSTRLFQHLVVCGLPSSFNRNQLPALENDIVINAALEIRPTVAAIYPKYGTLSSTDLNSVAMLAMPRGIRFFLSSQSPPAKDAQINELSTIRHPPEPELHAFVVTREDYSRVYGASLTFFEPYSVSLNGKARYVTKSVCLCLSMMATQASFAALSEVYRYISSTRMNTRRLLPSLIDWLEVWLFDVLIPSPSLGPALIRIPCGYSVNNSNGVPSPNWVTLSLPSSCSPDGELPFFDQSLAEVILLIGVDNLLTAVSAAMLEHQIVLLAKEPRHLTLAGEAIVSLLCPFEWQHVYAPIVPPSLQNFLEAPVPFIFGILDEGGSKLTDRLPPEARICVIYVDSGLVRPPDDLPPLPWHDDLARELSWLVRQHKLSKLSSLSGSGLPSSAASMEESSRSSSIDSVPASPSDEECVMSSGLPDETIKPSDPAVAESLNQSAAVLQRLSEIARRAGVPQPAVLASKVSSGGTISSSSSQQMILSSLERRCLSELRFNAAVRELFLSSFSQLFKAYSRFVLTANALDSGTSCESGGSTCRFDKAAFLSEQPADFVPFLARFLETQCFADFIANKVDEVNARTESGRNTVRLFDAHIASLISSGTLGSLGNADTRLSLPRPAMQNAISNLEKAFSGPHTLVSPPKLESMESFSVEQTALSSRHNRVLHVAEWPSMSEEDQTRLNKIIPDLEDSDNVFTYPPKIPLSETLSVTSPGYDSIVTQAEGRPRNISISNAMSEQGDTSQLFIQRLIDECRTKAKKLLLARIGLEEARALGHGSSSTVEESGLIIVSLTDLLERIWAHGIADRACRSPLWSHLVLFCDRGGSLPNMRASVNSQVGNQMSQSPPGESGESKFLKNIKERIQRSDLSPARRPSSPLSPRTPSKSASCLWEDVRFIQNCQDIVSDTGRTRAFVRLALERRRLADHLHELLADQILLQQMFRSEALLRQEEAREQLLAHLRSLGTVDLLCFTNSFPETELTYRVNIDSDRKLTECPSLWLSIVGSIRSAGPIKLPCAQPKSDLNFPYVNIGLPLCLRIGIGSPDEFASSGLVISPPESFILKAISVICAPTGHLFNFACGRKLGTREEPAAAEWLLLPDHCPTSISTPDSPHHSRRDKDASIKISSDLTALEILEILGNAVNSLVKIAELSRSPHGGSGRPSATVLVPLLLSINGGLAPCLVAALRHGTLVKRQSTTLMAPKTLTHPYESFSWLRASVPSLQTAMNDFEQSNCRLDRESKLILLLCRGLRDGVLIDWLGALTAAVADERQPMLSRVYAPDAFMRNPTCVRSLTALLASVQYYRLALDPQIEQPLFSIAQREANDKRPSVHHDT